MFKSIRPIIAAAILLSLVSVQVADAKKWTVYERQVQLTKEIDAGVKSGDLTSKEGIKLKDQCADINADVQKAKDKNAGKISVADETKIEKQLNKLSLQIQKKKLEKRVQ